MENMFLEGQATQRRTEYLAASGREGKAVAPKAWPAWRFVGNEIGESLEPVRPPEKFQVRKGAGVAGLMELRAASPSPYIRLYGPGPSEGLALPSQTLPDAGGGQVPKGGCTDGAQGDPRHFRDQSPKDTGGSVPGGRCHPRRPPGKGGAEEERGDA